MNIKETKTNPRNGEIYSVFEHEGHNFFANVCVFPTIGSECMIFEADEEGQITDWGELYFKRGLEVTEEALHECIKEFCESKQD